MSWLFSIRNLIYPEEKYIWAQVRIIYETDKAILADNGRKFWIPKFRIYGIRIRNNIFEIYPVRNPLPKVAAVAFSDLFLTGFTLRKAAWDNPLR